MDYANDPELDGKFLGTITADFALVAETLREASYQMRVRNISDHPIFPICKVDMALGQLIVAREEMNLGWRFHLSYLGEFAQRGLVGEDKLDAFKANYRDPDEFCCLFVVDEDFVRFVYVPYPEDGERLEV